MAISVNAPPPVLPHNDAQNANYAAPHGRLTVLLDGQVLVTCEVVRYEEREVLVKGLHAEAHCISWLSAR